MPNSRSRSVEYAGAGIQFAATFLVMGLFGWWLDGKLGTEPWLMIAGILLGATGAFVSLVKRVPPARRRPPRDAPNDPASPPHDPPRPPSSRDPRA